MIFGPSASDVVDELECSVGILSKAIDELMAYAKKHDVVAGVVDSLSDHRADINRELAIWQAKVPSENAEHRSAYYASQGVRHG